MNGQSVRERELFHGRMVQFLATSRGLVRLGPDRDDLVPVGEQAAQRRHCGFRRAHEDKTHWLSLLHRRYQGRWFTSLANGERSIVTFAHNEFEPSKIPRHSARLVG